MRLLRLEREKLKKERLGVEKKESENVILEEIIRKIYWENFSKERFLRFFLKEWMDNFLKKKRRVFFWKSEETWILKKKSKIFKK